MGFVSMSGILRPCPRCYHTMPADRVSCPRCGCLAQPSLEEKKHHAVEILYKVIVILCVVAAGVLLVVRDYQYKKLDYYYKYIYPVKVYMNEKVPVRIGSYKHCPINGENYDMRVRTIKVPRKKKGLYRVKVYKMCRPEVFAGRRLSSLSDLNNKLLDRSKITGDRRTEMIKKLYPEMSWQASWYMARGRLAVGMSRDEVLMTWGEPAEKLYFERNGINIERWRYKDPVYGLEVTNRYADFESNELAKYSEGFFPITLKTGTPESTQEVHSPRPEVEIESIR